MERGVNNGVEILGRRVLGTSGSVRLEQMKRHIFDVDSWERGISKCGEHVHFEAWWEIKVIFFSPDGFSFLYDV